MSRTSRAVLVQTFRGSGAGIQGFSGGVTCDAFHYCALKGKCHPQAGYSNCLSPAGGAIWEDKEAYGEGTLE